MKRQELSANRQVVQSAVLVRGRSGGTDPSAGPRRLGRALAAVHLLPREKENIVLGGGAPQNGLFKFSLRGCGPGSGGRRKQRTASALRESAAPETRRRNRLAHCGVSLPAGRQQGEQDRASPVQLHQPKLARQAAHQLRGHSPKASILSACRRGGFTPPCGEVNSPLQSRPEVLQP